MLATVSRWFLRPAILSTRSFATTRRLYSPAEMETVDTGARLKQLRELMSQHKVDIYSTTLTALVHVR